MAWQDMTTIKRGGQLVARLKTELSLTDAQINNLFRAAAAIDD
jgi:hypothetical protein